MNFVAFDVETANSDLASICQIGVVVYQDGNIIETWEQLVNPLDDFDVTNVLVHGINEATVALSPTFPDIFDRLHEYFSERIIAHHTTFDKISIAKAAAKNNLTLHDYRWIDTAKVARRTWAQFASKGYGLKNLAKHFEIEFRHHNAAEDARVSGEILLRALRETGHDVEQVAASVNRPAKSFSAMQGNPDGALAGEVIVFTGSLSLTRQEAATLASQAGCDVAVSVTKQTTLVVVGDQDSRPLGGQAKSSKHRKAEELIAKGQGIRILGESDFAQLIEL